jgi:predicted nuclease of predicted toxin-antitoxin system
MIRFLADASLHDAIVSGCRRREPAMDFLSANEAKLEGVPDPEVLALAAEQDRILVTHDFQTMPQHFGDFLQLQGSSPGVLLVPQYLPIGEAIEELVLIWSTSDAEEWENRILRIPLP